MNKINVLVLTSSYPFGKGESFIEGELSFLSQQPELMVDLCPTFPRGDYKDDAVEISGDYYNFSLIKFKYIYFLIKFLFQHPFLLFRSIKFSLVKSLNLSFRNLVLIPKATYMYYTIFDKRQYEFIYIHWMSAPCQLGLILHLFTSVDYGVTGHRWDLVENNNLVKKFDFASFIRVISEGSLKLFDEKLLCLFKSKIEVIKIGVPIRDSLPSLELKNNRIISVGNLIPVKGHRYLVQAIEQLKMQGTNVFLDIIGDGSCKKELQNMILKKNLSMNVRLLGSLPHAEVLTYLGSREYDVFVLPSIDLGGGEHEGLPVSLMEAMNFDLPCISTKTGSINELIEDGYNGMLVVDKQPIDLANAISKLLINDDLRFKIIKNAKKFLVKHHTESTNNNKLLIKISKKFNLIKD